MKYIIYATFGIEILTILSDSLECKMHGINVIPVKLYDKKGYHADLFLENQLFYIFP